MGSKNSGKRKLAPAAQPKRLAAEGGANKRTPQSAFDGAAGKDTYEPEKVVAERLAKGVTQYHVKWVDFDAKHNTWEPLEHLAGCEDLIADMKERKKQRDAELEAAAQAKKAEQEEAAAAAAAKKAAEQAAARTAQQNAGNADVAAGAMADASADASTPAEPQAKPGIASGTRRTAPIWAAFSEEGCEKGHACCILLKPSGEICGDCISTSAGPTNLWNHALYHHKADYMRLKPASEPLDFSPETLAQVKLSAVSTKMRDMLHKAIARWLVKRKRPLSLPEDPEFRDIFQLAMQGSYVPPDATTTLNHVVLLGSEGKKKLYDVNTSLREKGIKPGAAGDIWSSHGVSLFGMCQYDMTDDWKIRELLLAASPFSTRHTGDAIDSKTRDACVEAGLPHDVYSGLFFPVSDNGANMVKGWEGFGRGPCTVHTGQLSVKVFLEHAAIKPTRDKEHGITAHFSMSTGVDGLGALKVCQKKCLLPLHHPVKDNDTRWSSGHDQMEWFRVQQRSVQLYDVDHARKAGDAYKQHQMGLDDWTINLQSVATLQPVADWTQHLQGTKYPTLPLVLPTTYQLIDGMAPASSLELSFPAEVSYELEPKQMHAGVLSARTDMHDDFMLRWVTNLDPAVKRTYAIATLLHPCFKTYDFIDSFDFIPESDKAWALQELRTEWKFVWKPKPAAPDPAAATAAPDSAAPPAAAPTSAAPAETLTKKRKVTLGGMLKKMKTEPTADAATTKAEHDELEEYLAQPEEDDLDMKLLAWWQAREGRWPNLAKMVKQYFASPASSAGVERIFSAAGKMHSDLKKSSKDETLEASLFAMQNTD